MNNCYKLALYGGIIRICANIIMLASVFLAMYEASRWPGWPSEAVFCLFFFGITIPAWTLAWLCGRWVRRRGPAVGQSRVDLPGMGSQLVAWRVRENAEPIYLLKTDRSAG